MEWEKTTFGELKEGDYFVTQPISKSGDFTSLCIAKHCKWPKDLEVYRLVSPEREALEKIRPLLQEVVDTYNAPREVSQNFDWIEFIERATAALEDAQKGGGE